MQFQFTIYALPLVVAAVVSGWVAFYAWKYRGAYGAVALATLSVALAEWLLTYALEIMGADLPTKLSWAKIEYLGVVTVPLAWAVFAFNYANPGKHLNRWLVLFLAALATTTFVLVLTTDLHGLVWNNIHINQGAGFSVLGVSHGPWFWVHFAYAYTLLLAGAFFILRSVVLKQGVYRRQAAILIVAVAAPFVGNILYISGLNPIHPLDPTPFTFAISVVALTWGIFGFQLFALSPIARETIIDEMQDGIIVLDTRTRITDINPSALKIINVSDTNVIGKSAVEVLSRWPELVNKYRDVLQASDEISFGEGKDRIWYELRLSPLYNKRKRFIGRVITIRDITSSRRVEEFKSSFLNDITALQEIHLALSQVHDLPTLYIQMIALSQQRLGLDRVGLFVINDQTNEIQGTYGVDPGGNTRDESYYREKITPGHWTLEILDSITYTKLWENAELMDNGVAVGMGWKIGAALWTGHQGIGYLMCDNFLTHKPLRPYETELLALLGTTFGHLIERTRIEASLQESEARYRQFVENASDIIYRTDIQGLFTYVNPIGVHLMGLASEAELLGRHYLELVNKRYHHRMKRFYDRQFMAKQKNTYREFPTASVNGRELWLGQNVQLIEENGRVIGFQAVARDITDLVEARDSLALARDQALEASKLKSQLLAKVSHELRTPLGGILGYAELLRYGAFGPLEEKQEYAASQIIDSAHYLTAMVNELLDQAQAESKSVILHIDNFNVNELVQHVEASMTVLAGKKGLVLRTSIAPNVPETLRGDRQRLQQILINLAGNAIKFTKTGEVSIHLYCPNDTHWAIQVADTGAGVPEEAQAYIFEPFRQANNAITRENLGTGLGLSITKQLVELMRGEITLESEVDKGSTFTIILPILKDTEKSE
jgi:PAS domain S-box-containing protein